MKISDYFAIVQNPLQTCISSEGGVVNTTTFTSFLTPFLGAPPYHCRNEHHMHMPISLLSPTYCQNEYYMHMPILFAVTQRIASIAVVGAEQGNKTLGRPLAQPQIATFAFFARQIQSEEAPTLCRMMACLTEPLIPKGSNGPAPTAPTATRLWSKTLAQTKCWPTCSRRAPPHASFASSIIPAERIASRQQLG